MLAEIGLSVGETAARLGISRVTLSRVLHGQARIAPTSLPASKRPAWAPHAHDWPCRRPTTSPPSEQLAPRKSAACNQSPHRPATEFVAATTIVNWPRTGHVRPPPRAESQLSARLGARPRRALTRVFTGCW
ncbi:hypothetical protein [Knoellia sinensis]|uniref:hypothetical protein n=1 Tax=Knoellia sinensis TaxID=136100 RepID=UPI001B80A1DB